MTGPRLPDGFAVQVDRRVKVLGEGSALLGGSPTRLLRLAPAAQTMLTGGRLEVHDAVSAQLARTLLDATVAHPRPATGPSHRDVTVVIPVRDNISGLRRLVAALRGMRIVVVDDGSASPVQQADFAQMYSDVQILRHDRSKGPAAARNTGLAACHTDFVAFLDSDVVPRRGWLEALLGHFCDPAVALVAPRIIGLREPENLVARYEAVTVLARPRHARGAGGALRDRRRMSPAPRSSAAAPSSRNWVGSTRRSSPAKTSTCAGG